MNYRTVILDTRTMFVRISGRKDYRLIAI